MAMAASVLVTTTPSPVIPWRWRPLLASPRGGNFLPTLRLRASRIKPFPSESRATAAVARAACAVAPPPGGDKAEERGQAVPELGALAGASGAGGTPGLRRARMRRRGPGGGGLDQSFRVRGAGRRVAAQARLARRGRRFHAGHAAGARAAGGHSGGVLDAARPRPPHRPIRSWEHGTCAIHLSVPEKTCQFSLAEKCFCDQDYGHPL